MANRDHLKILRQGVEAWNRWKKKDDPTFTPADLSNADLRGFDLRRSDFFGADLSGANLAGVRLDFANLAIANLSGADLERAVLRYTILTKAIVEGTNLANCKLSRVTFSGLDLRQTRGLRTCNFLAPCAVDFETLMRSWPLPVSFLRGCGLPEEYVAYLPSLLNQPLQFYSCFISYSHRDKAFARRMYDQLQGRGIRCWLDEHAMVPGDDIYDAVDRGIRLSDKILLCCSRTALKDSWWVDDEIAKALEKEQELSKSEGKKVRVLIPLNLDGFMFRPGWRSGYKATLKRRLAADFSGWEKDNDKFEAQLERVVQALRQRSDEA